MSDSEFEIVKAIPNPVLRRLVRVKGVEFDEAFVAELIDNYFNRKELRQEPKLSEAMAIYLHESNAGATAGRLTLGQASPNEFFSRANRRVGGVTARRN